jgi:UDPglucose 6-dehydrogenase
MKIGVIGAGYVGLTTGICLASLGHNIVIYDIDSSRLSKIKQKQLPFFETGLQELLIKVIDDNTLSVVDTLSELVNQTNGSFVCVGTPSKKDDSINLSQITDSLKQLIPLIKEYDKDNYVVIIRSTVVPTTCSKTLKPILEESLDPKHFSLCTVPEFLREGQAMDDFMHPDKIVIGYFDDKSKCFVENIFEDFKDTSTFILTNTVTAELIKYTNNAFFSTLISFSNEIANISEKIKEVDAFEVMNALISDKRITSKINGQKIIPGLSSYLSPGCGFGGSCFPKDVKAIASFSSSVGVKTPILDSVLSTNRDRPNKIISIIDSILPNLDGLKITILGVSFKPDTDDIRESPALDVMRLLEKRGAKVTAYDPQVKLESLQKIGINNVSLTTSIEDSLNDSSAAVLLTKWPELKKINQEFLSRCMKNPVIVDGRGYLNKNDFSNHSYFKIGYVQ